MTTLCYPHFPCAFSKRSILSTCCIVNHTTCPSSKDMSVLKSWCYCVYSCDDYSESRASLASELHGQFPFHRKDKLPLTRFILLHSRDFRRRTHSWRSQSGRSKHPVTCFLSTTANRWRGTIESRAGCPEKHTVRSENAVVWHETGDLSLDCSN